MVDGGMVAALTMMTLNAHECVISMYAEGRYLRLVHAEDAFCNGEVINVYIETRETPQKSDQEVTMECRRFATRTRLVFEYDGECSPEDIRKLYANFTDGLIRENWEKVRTHI